MVKKKGMQKRYQSSYESKGNGGSRVGIMDWKKAEGDVSFYSPSEGKNRINIIPYIIKSKNHPLVRKGEFEIGDKDYVLDVYSHRSVGPTESSVVCLKSTYGKPCPICEQAALLRKKGKDKEADLYKPSRRVIYNVQDMKDPEKLKIFETSHYLFEKELIEEARDDDEGFVDFADEESGKEIRFRCSKVSRGGFEFNEYKSFSFIERDENIPDDLLEAAIPLDDLLVVPTYEQVEAILYGKTDDDDEPPVKKSSAKKQADDDDDDDDEPPVKKSSAKKQADDDDDDDDEPPVKKSSAKKNSDGCPFGHKFGTDCDSYDDCDDCDKWDVCVRAAK